MKTISITTGDKKSIGLEVTTKALSKIPERLKKSCIITWRSASSSDSYFK